MSQKTAIIIGGPTAVGKTALAIRLAQHYNTTILSADSRQCFRELTIGVARPSTEELAAVPHDFIATHSIEEVFSAADYEAYALRSLEQTFATHDHAIVCGGTGLYIKALMQGLDDIPPVEPAIREAIIADYEKNGLRALQETVRHEDPLYYESGEIRNPQRLMRALEVMRATGRSIRSFQQAAKAERSFRIIPIRLSLPREQLYQRIDQRVDQMMAAGLLDEVKGLFSKRQLNALQTVGYQELFAFLEGSCTLEEAVQRIKTNTRHYAKRQETWLKKYFAEEAFAPDAFEEILIASR